MECPFCNEDDFDAIGLKYHLTHHCDAYDAVDISSVKSLFRGPQLKRKMSDIKTDLDLAPAFRTQANLWKAKFFEIHKAVVQANKGIRRLRRKLSSDKCSICQCTEPVLLTDWRKTTMCQSCGKPHRTISTIIT